MKKTILTIASVLLFSVGAMAQTADEVNAKFNEAATLYNNKDYNGAITALEKTVEMSQSSSDDCLATMTEAQSYLAKCYRNLGVQDASAGRFDDAAEKLTKARDLSEMADPAGVRAIESVLSKVYKAKASTALKAEDSVSAAKSYEQAIAVNNKDTEAMLLAAQCYGKSGDFDKAGELYTAVIELGKTHSKYEAAAASAKDAYVTDLLSSAVKASDDYASARTLIMKAIEVDPASEQANMLLLQSANNAKDFDTVISYGDAAIAAQTTPEAKSNACFLVAVAAQTKGDNAKAVKYYQQVTAGPNAATAKAQVAALNK